MVYISPKVSRILGRSEAKYTGIVVGRVNPAVAGGDHGLRTRNVLGVTRRVARQQECE